MKPKLSVIIPCLNEENYISQLLDMLTLHQFDWLEVIVVDGGSTDNSKEVVADFPKVLWKHSEKGRANQMNSGAEMAKGDYLLFLHADTIITSGFLKDLKLLLVGPIAGSFKMEFDHSNYWLKFYSKFTQYNWPIFTYGDQGLLVNSDLFVKVGGFREIPILEDIDLVRRIKGNDKFVKLNMTVKTSSRRFNKNGYVLQQLKNILIVIGYYLGLSPYFLKRFYRY